MTEKAYGIIDRHRALDVQGVSVFNKAHARLMMGYACMAEKDYRGARAEFGKVLEVSVYP